MVSHAPLLVFPYFLLPYIRAIAHGVSWGDRVQESWIITRECANHQAWLADWRDVRYNADEQWVER